MLLTRGEPTQAVAELLGLFSPLTALLSRAARPARRWLSARSQTAAMLLHPVIILALVLLLVVRERISMTRLSVLGLGLLAAFWAIRRSRRVVRARALLGLVLVITLSLPQGSPLAPETDMRVEIAEAAEMAKYARTHTPSQAVFLTPPDWGQFRLLARRAIVVDFKAFPFQDMAMAAWYERLTTCYGTPQATGFAMLPALKGHYAGLDDPRLEALRNRYGIGYAVLYAQTPTSLPVLHATANHKLVALE
jgi:hypothetical protein